MKIATVVGARPQFIKAAAVSAAFARAGGVDEVLVHTGQHFDRGMSSVFFDELDVPDPRHNLGVAGGRHGDQTGRMLAAIEEVLVAEAPDVVLVYGDTNSTLAGALAAAKLNVPVAHVEAGLRSFNRRMPEEVNRVVTDHVAALLFAPTRTAVANLAREGVNGSSVHLVGDVMLDVALRFARVAEARSTVLDRLALRPGGFVLATIHRQENTDAADRLAVVFRALAELARDVPVVVPMHPRTRRTLEGAGRGVPDAPGLLVVDPVGYLDMVMLERHARLVVTDSGGVQKEAFFYRVPCVTLRDETEWVELVDAGWNTVVAPTDAEGVLAALRASIAADRPPEPAEPIFGDGHAAERIAAALAGR